MKEGSEIITFKNHGQNTSLNSALEVFGQTERVQKTAIRMAKDLEARSDVKRELQWFNLEKADSRLCCRRRVGLRNREPGTHENYRESDSGSLWKKEDFLMQKLLRD